MATTSPSRHDRIAPAEDHVPQAVPQRGSDKAAGPFPLVDIVGRPFLTPHRLAQAMGDRRAVYDRSLEVVRKRRGDRIADRLHLWVIVIATTLMGVALLMTAVDAFLDRTL